MSDEPAPASSSAPRPSWARYAAALAVGLGGTLAIGAGAGMLMLASDRRGSASWLLVAGGVAVAGLIVVIAATRLARLRVRRALIAVLAALLVAPPIAQTVRLNVAASTSHAPKHTASDLRNLGIALESRAIDEGGYPPTAAVGALAPLLEGRYIRQVPLLDAWGNPLRFESDGAGRDARYFVGSAGPDGRWQHAHLAEYRDLSGPHGDDIVYSNGGFVTSPGANR